MRPVYVVIAAAGSGTRMKTSTNKQFLPLAGKPVLLRTMEIFDDFEQISGYVVVTAENNIPAVARIAGENGLNKLVAVISGGSTRQDSVKAGLDFLRDNANITASCPILVHDGARCLVSRSVISRVIEGIRRYGACGAALQVKDTIKIADASGKVVQTPRRDRLWAMQTPQGATGGLLFAAYEAAGKNGWQATDDLALLELSGNDVYVVAGDEKNIKITTLLDLELAEALISGK